MTSDPMNPNLMTGKSHSHVGDRFEASDTRGRDRMGSSALRDLMSGLYHSVLDWRIPAASTPRIHRESRFLGTNRPTSYMSNLLICNRWTASSKINTISSI